MPQRMEDPESAPSAPLVPVRRSIQVRGTPERAFHVFTAEMDTWWPRTHHIGTSPMKAVIVEGRVGGSIYTLQEDGTSCPWGSGLPGSRPIGS